jgi:FolB domain-containing protein
MSKITIVDLEVNYCVGVTDEERAKPQRLLLTVDMSLDFSSASVSDRIERTINYQEVVDELLKFGEGRAWKLLEKLVANVADRVLTEFKPQAVLVEVKKFSIPQARFISVSTGQSMPLR